MKRLSDTRHSVLSALYQLRALSYQEIREFIIPGLSGSYLDKILKELIRQGYMEKRGTLKKNFTYQITQKGVRYLVQYGIKGIGDGEMRDIPVLLPSSRIRLSDHILPHQISLNHFVLRWAKKRRFDYYDERYVSAIMTGVRPDGIIVEDRLYLLEMDMGTERERALSEKWEHYRDFLRSGSCYVMDRDMLGMFIIGGYGDPSKRRTFLRRQMLTMLPDLLSPRFNFVVGTEDELLGMIDRDDGGWIRQYFEDMGFGVGSGTSPDGAFGGFRFDHYMNKLTPDGKLVMRNGEAEEYLVDDLTDGNMYSLYKLSSISSVESSFSYKYRRTIKLIAIVGSEEEGFGICRDLDVFDGKVYLTTPSRLRSLPFNNALFQVDKRGNRWHFSEEDLRVRIGE